MTEDTELMARLSRILSAKTPFEESQPCQGRPSASVLLTQGYDFGVLEAFRKTLPEERVLLHIHSGGGKGGDAPGRSMKLDFSESGRHRDQVATLLKAMKPCDVRVSTLLPEGSALETEAERLRDVCRLMMSNLSVDRYSSLVRLRCSLLNLPSILSGGAMRLNRRDEPGMSAIVCGAGPSLIGQLDLLERASGRALIVACGHAAVRMKDAGVEPDFIVEADPRSRRNWPEGIRFESRTLVALTCVDPDVAGRFNSWIWAEGDSSEFSSVCRRIELKLSKIAVSRGVVVSAIDFARQAGCRRIALVGCDLAVAPSGMTHAGARRADGDTLNMLEVGGSDCPKVSTTRDFDEIRLALEAYLASPACASVKALNCSPGGAKIDGAERMEFEAFVSSLPDDAGSIGMAPEGRPSHLPHFERIASAIAEYREVGSELAACARRLERELDRSPMDMGKVNTLRDAMKSLAERETELAVHEDVSPFASLAKERSDDIFTEAHGFNPALNDPSGMLSLLRRKTLLASAICKDISGDLGHSIQSMKGCRGIKSRDPLWHEAYREFASGFIAVSNPSLASVLEGAGDDLPALADRFELHLKFEDMPLVSRVLPDGRRIQFSGLLSVRDDAMKLNSEFERMSGFNPERHAIAFIAPGNWAVVEEFAKRHPGLHCMVIDPWPELLRELAGRTMFLHRLRHGTPIVSAHSTFKSWRKVCMSAVDGFMKKRLDVLTYRNTALSSLPEVVDMDAELRDAGILQKLTEVQGR